MTKDTGFGFETSIATVNDIGVNTNPVLDSSKGLKNLLNINTNDTNIIKISRGIEYIPEINKFNFDLKIMNYDVIRSFVSAMHYYKMI